MASRIERDAMVSGVDEMTGANAKAAAFLTGELPVRMRRRVAVVSSCAFLALAHLYCWTNSLYSHDSLMIVQNDWAHQIGIGRFLQQAYALVRGAVVAPWLVGALGSAFIVLSVLLVVRLLDLKGALPIVGIAAAMTTNATVTLVNATYLDWFDIMMLALLLMCLATYLSLNMRWGVALAAVLVAASMGLYQGYIGMALGLVAIWVLRRLLASQDVLAPAVKAAVALAVGAVLYLVMAKVVQSGAGVEVLDTYNSVGNLGLGSFGSLAGLVPGAYAHVLSYWMFPETHVPRLMGILNAALVLATICILVYLVRVRRARAAAVALVVALCLGFPLLVGCVYVMTGGVQHALMVYPYCCLYLFSFAIIDVLISQGAHRAHRRSAPAANPMASACAALLAVAIGLLAFNNIVYSNQVYLKKDLEYSATQAMVNRIIVRMDEVEGYDPGQTPVAFVGAIEQNVTLKGGKEGFPPHESQPAFSGIEAPENYTDYATGLYRDISIFSTGELPGYINLVMGYPIVEYEGELPEEVSRGMEVYPSESSMKVVDGVLVVRLS